MTFPVAKLGEVCSFVRGLTYSKSDEVEFSSNVVVRATNIDLSTHKLDFSELRYISDSIQVKDDKRLKKNDILICTASGSKSHLGKVALVECDLGMSFGGFMGALRVNPQRITPQYLFAFLVSSDFKRHIESLSDGANINNLKFSQIENLELPLPSLSTQQKIVAKLDAIFAESDKATAAAEANAKNAEALFHSYLRKIFNVNLENTKKIDEVCDFINGLWTGKKPPFLNVSVIRNTNFRKNGELDYSDIAQLEVEARQFTSRQLRFGDIVLEKSGGGPKQPVGRVCVFEREDGNFSLSNFTSAIRVKNTQELHFKYLHFYLQHMYIEGETEKIQTNSTGIRNLQLSLYKEFNIPLPTLTNQKLIVNNLKNFSLEADISHNSYKAKVSELNKLKKSILRQAFSGDLVKE